jgi:hypothetical protein
VTLDPLRHGRLRKMGQSPLHFAADVERAASFFDKGQGAHSALLGGKRIITWDKKSEAGNQCPRRGKDWDAFNAANRDALILLPDEYEQVQRMAEAVSRCPDAMWALKGIKETTVYWDVAGRKCRATPDVDGGDRVTELKSTKCAKPSVFRWDVKRYNYDGALAWYQDGLTVQPARRVIPKEAFIVAVESGPVQAVTVFRIPPQQVEQARRVNRMWFEQLMACEASEAAAIKAGKTFEWPAYAQSIVDLEYPDEQGIEIAGAEEEAA